jgi:glutamate racemase
LSSAPLGVFDSGLGGLTVVRALRQRLPRESIVYLGDTARVPYGTRSEDTILRYARSCASVLTKRGVKALVIACNTASAVALDMLRAELDLPVIGVIEPGASAAVEAALRSEEPVSRIGVLATARTVATGAYTRAVGRLTTRLEVVGQAAPLLVPLVEEGWIDGDVPRLAAERYVAPLVEAGAGVIVLGCTHYPVLRRIIEDAATRLAGKPIPVVDSAEATADAVAHLLKERALASPSSQPGTLDLLVTDLPASFSSMAERCLGGFAPDATQIDL